MRSNISLLFSFLASALCIAGSATGQLVDQGGYAIEDADLNGDGSISRDDANLVMSAWGNPQSALDIVDSTPINGPTSDGLVDVDDLNLVQIFTGLTIFNPLENENGARGDEAFFLRGVDIGGDPQSPDLLKGSPIRTSSGSPFYFDDAASGFIYAPTMGELISEPSLEYTSYVALSSGPTTSSFTADTPDFSTPGFTNSSGHFDTAGEVGGAWYTDAGVASSPDYPGQGQGVHVLRLSVPRGETLDTSDAVVRALVLISPTTYVVNLPLQGGAVTQDEFGGTLPVPLEARAILAAQPDNVGTVPAQRGTGVDLDVYDVYVAEATVIRVDPSGKGDSTTIQGAINLAKGGETILVEPGTYQENLVFVGLPLVVSSTDPSDPASFIIDGSLGDNQSVVTFDKGEGPDTVLRGFTITGGDATLGGGILCSISSPTIDRCVISSNNASSTGGGLRTVTASPHVVDCLFENNSSFSGGAIANVTGQPLMERCRFVSNNAASRGGAIQNNAGFIEIVNSVFELNDAMLSGGAIDQANSSGATILNCTFVKNSAGESSGGAIHSDGGGLAVANSIFWDNGTDPITGGAQDVSYSIVEGGQAGTGNLDQDPLFVSPIGVRGQLGDYSLLAGSPAIDAGDSTAIAGTAGDLLGNSRFVDDTGTPNTGVSSGFGIGSPQDFAVGSSPRSVTADHMNADGILDLVTANFGDNSVSVLIGNSDGTFQPQQTLPAGDARHATTGDLNGDGSSDIVVANSVDDDLSVILNNGDGTFQSQQLVATGQFPIFVVVRDVDGDGASDICVANQADDSVGVHFGIGNGTFQAADIIATGDGPRAIAVGDLNGDGELDFAVANRLSNNVSVLISNGDRTYQSQPVISVGERPVSISIRDIDGDNSQDIVVANGDTNDIAIIQGNGDATFQAITYISVGMSPSSLGIEDLNGDGILDLVVANQNDDTVSILLGEGDGTFQAEQTLPTGDNPSEVALADLDNNGSIDIAVSNNADNNASILLNTTLPPVDLGALEFQGTTPLPTIFVNANADGEADGTSWDGAFTNLQDAIDLLASTGDENTQVFVAQGTYVPQSTGARGTDFSATFSVPNGAHLIGGFSGDGSETDASQSDPANNLTVLSGDTNGDDGPNFTNRSDNRWHVVTLAQDGAVTATLEGFTISGGNANGTGADANGGGIFVGPQGLTLIDCVVTDNMAANSGAGVYLGLQSISQDRGGSPSEFNGTLFSGNSAQIDGGAIFAQDPDSIDIQSCRFENNNAASGDGGAVWVANTISSTAIYDTVFDSNTADNGLGGALYSRSNGEVQIDISEFMSNTANEGGAIARDSMSENDELNVLNCMFDGNSSSFDGGAVYADISSGEVILVNTGFFQNDAGGAGGAISVRESFMEGRGGARFFTVDQCVFANNSVPEAGAAINVTGENIDVFIAQSSFGGHADADSVLETEDNLTLVNCAFGDNTTNFDILAFGFGNTIRYNVFQALNLADDKRSEESGAARGNPVFDNIEGEDPLFKDVASGDLDLLPNSPAIDAGDTGATSLVIDFLGRDRFQDDTGTPDTGLAPEEQRGSPIVDIGAYEFQGTSMSPGSFPFSSTPTQIDEELFYPALALGDIDGDSDLDILMSLDTGKGPEVVWYESSRGDFSASNANFVMSEEAVALDAGDMDNDGDIDALVLTGNSVQFGRNNGGPNPNFSSSTVVPSLTNPRSAKLGDLDNDGDLDVIVGLNDGDEPLRWYENTIDESRSFQENIIETVQGDFTGLGVGELNGDADLDFAAYDNDTGSVRAYLNTGNGVGFTRVIVDGGAFANAAPVIADIDGDGLGDIVYAKDSGIERGGSTLIAVAFNDGDGSSYSLVEASDAVGRITSLDVADIDGDGDLDIAAGDISNGQIIWIQNNGDGSFDTLLAYSDSVANSIQLALADMTLDGDMDLIAFDSSVEESKNLLLIENLLIHRDTDFPAGRVLAREANGITTTDAADLDGDGDLDLISGSFFDNKVIWYENPGDVGGLWDHHELGDQITTGVTSVHALDYDNDGDLDIAATGIVSNSVDIYFNEINENSGDPTAFTGLSLVDGSLTAANDVQSGDFDNDGDLDLLAVGAGANEILIALNPQNDLTRGPGGGVQTVSVTTQATGVRAAIPVDVDNDGDLDIISAEFTAGEVRWYNNTGDGDGTTWERNFIAGVGTSPIDVVAGDFDRDGDADVAFADFATGDLWWYQNEFVESQLWEANNFASGLGGPSALTVCDFNDDGFLDIGVANRFSNRVRYYINSRAIGEFDSTDFMEANDSPVTTTAMGVQSVGSADLDGDGRCDLFVGTFAGDAMIRYRNLGGQFEVSDSAVLTSTMDDGTDADILQFDLRHLGDDADIDLAMSGVSMRLLDAAGSLLNATKSEQIFESISIQAMPVGRGQEISPVEIGAVSDFSGVSDLGMLTVPIDSDAFEAQLSAGSDRTFTLVVSLQANAAMNSQGGFQIQMSDPDTPSAVHADFNSGELILQGDSDIDTGVVTVTEPQNLPCVADCDGSGVVNFSDLICILGNFGLDDAPGDVDGSGTVNFTDLVSALAFFGPCDN